MDAWEAAKNALECVLEAKRNESVVVSQNHMDFLISKPTVRVFNTDGSSINVLLNGDFPHL